MTNQKAQHIRNIIFPTTIELNKGILIGKLEALQTCFNAKLHLLYIKTPDSRQKDQELETGLENFARFYNLKKRKPPEIQECALLRHEAMS